MTLRLLGLALLVLLAGPVGPHDARADGDAPPAALLASAGTKAAASASGGSAVGAKSYEMGFYGNAPQPTRYWFTTSAPAAGTITDLYSAINGASGANYIVSVSICHAGSCAGVPGLVGQGVSDGENGAANPGSDLVPLHTQPSGGAGYSAGDAIALDFSAVGGTFTDVHENIRVQE